MSDADRTLLFDEPYYLRINEVRWGLALYVLGGQDIQIGTCLDVGCGPGWFAERLVGERLAVDAVDGRPELVSEGARRVPQARFICANLESDGLALARPSYDFVLCFGLLYHTENPFKVIRNIAPLTRGVLLVESMLLPDDGPYLVLHSEGHNETQGLTYHALVPSRTALVKMLQVTGLQVYEYRGTLEHEDFVETAERYRRRGVLARG